MSHRTSAPRLLVVMLAPLFVACPNVSDEDFAFPPSPPQCGSPNELLSTDSSGRLFCASPPPAAELLPTCKKYSEALTTDGKTLSCTFRNTESQASRTAQDNLETMEKLLNDLTIRVRKSVTPSIPYCGLTPNQPSAAFAALALRGIEAASALCANATGCRLTSHMCSVYEMFNSVVNGAGVGPLPMGKAWVYMASWSQEFSDDSGTQKEPGAGLADNCGSFTVGDSTRKWYGTAVSWATISNGATALTFPGGPPNVGVPGTSSIVANANSVDCGAVLPIACCN